MTTRVQGGNTASGASAGPGGNAAPGGSARWPHHRRLAFAGWALYLLSWITPAPGPALEPRWFGARAFLASVEQGVKLLFHPQSVAGGALALCLLAGWLANFSLLAPLSARARVAWSLAPWLPFLGGLLLMNAPLAVRERMVWQLYFYPWAIGIACVHAAMIMRQR